MISDGISFNFVTSEQRSNLTVPKSPNFIEQKIDVDTHVSKIVTRHYENVLKHIEFYNSSNICILKVGTRPALSKKTTTLLKADERIVGVLSRMELPIDGKHCDF